MLLEDQTSILNRLKDIELHLFSIISMVESEENCIEILEEIQAIQEIILFCGRSLLQTRLRECLEKIRYSAGAEQLETELEQLADLYRCYQEFSLFETQST